jgi:mono/diheme cytochrome c family protein
VLKGCVPPATGGNRRHFGMPSLAALFSDDGVAQVLTFIRSSWGNRAAAVSALDVARVRGTR